MTTLQWTERISSDTDVVDRFLYEGIDVQTPDIGDLSTAIEWLALYGAETAEDAQPYANVIAYLEKAIATKQKRAETARQKRAYAAYFGVPVRSVRVLNP